MCRTIRAGRCAGASARSGRWSTIRHPPTVADRQTVELRTEGSTSTSFPRRPAPSRKAAATGDLARAASSFRGPLLADLDLPANSDFSHWLLGLREDARKLQAKILAP
jgi:hypothetical protein